MYGVEFHFFVFGTIGVRGLAVVLIFAIEPIAKAMIRRFRK